MPNHAHSQKAESKADERKRAEILADTRATFTSEHGQRELELLKQSVRHGEPAFVFPPGSPADPILAAFRDGRKSVILEILARLETPEDQPEPKPPEGKR